MNNRYSSLDGLRSFAAIGIVIMHIHANMSIKPDDNFFYATMIPSLSNLICVFFVISAFAMCCGYYEKIKGGQISMNKFYSKRYRRLLPFFALMVLIDCLVPHGANKYELSTMVNNDTVIHPWLEQLYNSFANLTLTFNLLPNPDIKVIGVGWFLGVVFLFYMLFPFFIFMMDNKRRAWISMSIVFIYCYIAIEYFFTDIFIDFKSHKNIIYFAPFFGVGGIIYLYRETISSFVKKYNYVVLVLAWLMTVGYWLYPASGFFFVVEMCALCAIWLIYAIGTEGNILNNRFTKYLSGISMEVYLCHMMAFRGVDMLHLSRIITQPDLLYWLTCILTLGGAIIFSHIVKYKVLPLVEPYIFKQNTK